MEPDAAPVATAIRDRIAVITIDRPPVNALSTAVRAGLLDAVRRAAADRDVDALVIACAGRTFIAGADLAEFDRPPEPPHLPELTQAIEDCPKPVVAALFGTALGGGFEVALACHYRVATPGARIGLPEVKLGLIPGAGGTQRLPRLVGFERALAMIVGGDVVGAVDALAAGALDEIAGDDVVTAAAAAARRLATAAAPLRRSGALAAAAVDRTALERARRDAAKRQRGQHAPLVAIDALCAAATLPLAEGLIRERALFLELRRSEQAAALRYAFLAEREVAKLPGLGADAKPRAIHRAGVVGAGTMGAAIAMCFANAGLPVALLDVDAAGLARGLENIRRNYATSVARGSLAQAAMDERVGRIAATLDWDALREADVVVEAAFEDIDVKRQVFEALDAVARPGAVLATNTSYLDVATIAGFTTRPQDVVGMHFFSPANVMRLLEVVRTPRTAPAVLATAMRLGRALGKVAVPVMGSDGFVGNRMLMQRTRETFFLLEEGALPQDVDRALVEFGFAMGPFAVADLSGLDIGWANRKARAHRRLPGMRDCNLLDQVCERGRLGQKTGAGWYRYEAGDRTPRPDPEIEALIVAHSRATGIERRPIPDEEIVGRCVWSMVNEGARILEEGVVTRALDIDMVWLHGYGFPAWRGGPMYAADAAGLTAVHDAILRYRDRFGPDYWTPAPLLGELARTGGRFTRWARDAGATRGS
ncbi:MAG: enoyl-CoA hydratase/isomerase family protein [Proteobacteria bacterium]|jgi:3-hydroxyacyl-CoA dehydrogenase|nr:enoyl-CoA hydratase/isomerase family protein [Pseudomonadota bacterium]